MKVEIYDQYKKILDNDGVTVLHQSQSSTASHGEYATLAEAAAKVTELYEQSKALGTTKDISVDLSKAYAELVITFADKKVLQRVIYKVE